MSSWVETSAPNFSARHEVDDADDAMAVLELLEGTRERLGSVFTRLPDEVAVVLHPRPGQLAIAQPYLPLMWILTAPAGRRYLAGWCTRTELHVLAPKLLERHASSVPGSREMIMLSPAALYTQLVVATNNRGLPPPFKVRSIGRYLRWWWLLAGAAQYFSGQTAYARPAIARRLRDGGRPAFPPGIRDANLLGGSIFDLVATERSPAAAVALACTPPHGSSRRAIVSALGGRALVHSEGAWRAHLARLAEP
jgi:hypothetical protein